MKDNCIVQDKNIARRVAVFYVFINLFNVWLNKKNRFSYLLLNLIYHDMLLWQKEYQENSASQKYAVRKWEVF